MIWSVMISLRLIIISGAQIRQISQLVISFKANMLRYFSYQVIVLDVASIFSFIPKRKRFGSRGIK